MPMPTSRPSTPPDADPDGNHERPDSPSPPPPPYKDEMYSTPASSQGQAQGEGDGGFYMRSTTTLMTTTTVTQTQTHDLLPSLSLMPLLRRKSLFLHPSPSPSPPPSIDRSLLMSKPLPLPPDDSPSAPSLCLTPSSPPDPTTPTAPPQHTLPSPPSNTPTAYLAHASLLPLQGLGLPPPPPLSPSDPTDDDALKAERRFSMIRRAKSFDRSPRARAGSSSRPSPTTKPARPRRPRTATTLPETPTPSAAPEQPRKASFAERASAMWTRKSSLGSGSPAPSPSPISPSSPSPSAHTPTQSSHTPNFPPSTSPSRSSTTPSSPLRTPGGLLPPFRDSGGGVEKKTSSGFLRLARATENEGPNAGVVEREERGRRRASTLFGPSSSSSANGAGAGRVHTPPALPEREKEAEREREREPRTRSSTLDSLASLAQSFPWAAGARQSVILSANTPPVAATEPGTPTGAGVGGGGMGLLRRASLGRLGGERSRRRTESGGGSRGGLEGLVEGQALGAVDADRERERDRRKREEEGEEKTEERREMELELERLVRTVGRTDLAGVLCGTPLLALHLSHLRPSPFPLPPLPPLPLDISLRVLLMHLALPRETQAIDRVVEAFAKGWAERYAGLVTADQAYLIAFSLIMLHTDHFNKSNKRKMSREDYVRNTRSGGGVCEVVLEYFYDNITFAPFIFIEDSTDVNGQRSLGSSSDASPTGAPLTSSSSSAGVGKRGKRLDLYYLISQGRLDPLRYPVSTFIPPRNPLSFLSSSDPAEEDEEVDMPVWIEQCHEAFAGASEVYVDLMNAAGASGIALGPGGLGPGGGGGEGQHEGGMVVKLTKVGAMLRKEDFVHSTKKPSSRSSKWRNFGVAITGSQLLFFKDPNWIAGLKEAADEARVSGGQTPRLQAFKPDEWVSLREAVAVWDASYDKFENVFRLVLPHGRHFLFQAPSVEELNGWLARINYAASFKTAGVRMRSAGMTGRQLGLAALAAAESHVRDVKSSANSVRSVTTKEGADPTSAGRVISLDEDYPTPSLSASPLTTPDSARPSASSSTSPGSVCDPADQLEATFREIKAELAAASAPLPGITGLGLGLPSSLSAGQRATGARAQSLFVNSTSSTPGVGGAGVDQWRPDVVRSSSLGLMQPYSANSSGEFSARKGWLALRSDVIGKKISAFEQERAKLEPHLASELRQARNLAILTPFQRSTRDRIQAAVQPLAKRVAQLRLELTRLKCYCEVLAADLEAEKREWAEARRVAFDAAESRLGGLRVDVPRMTLSMHLESPKELDSAYFNFAEHGSRPVSHRRPSSATTNGSYHSAIDTQEMAWPTPDHSPAVETPRSLFRSPSSVVGSSAVSSEGTSARFAENGKSEPPSYPFPAQPAATIPRNGTDSPLSQVATPGSPEDDVQAEDWTSTRAAKRVSLVQITSSGLYPRDHLAEDAGSDSHRRSVLASSIVEGDSFEDIQN